MTGAGAPTRAALQKAKPTEPFLLSITAAGASWSRGWLLEHMLGTCHDDTQGRFYQLSLRRT